MPAVTILSSGSPVAVLDNFQSMDWTRPYWTAGKFTLTVDPSNPNAAELIKGRLLLPPDSNIVYIIEQVLREDDGPKSARLLTASGRDLGGFFAERVCLPTAGLDYDTQLSTKAETAMKHYVNLNAGPGAASQRQIPGLTIAADSARGIAVNVQARYQYLSDIAAQIGQAGGLGWQILYTSGTLVFDVIPGVDRTASVYFDAAFDTSETQAWLTSDVGTKTYDYVAGQGVGAARTIVTRYTGGSEPTGFSRRELFTDARDLSDSTAMASRGDAELAALSIPDRFEATIPAASSFKYRTDWDLGDLVTIRNAAWGLSQTSRIIGVELKLDAGSTSPVATVTLGRPFPSLQTLTTGGGGATAAAVTADSGTSGGGGVSLASTTPNAEAYGSAGNVGTGTTAARSDHVHAMPSAPDFSPYAPLAGATFTGAVSFGGDVSASGMAAFKARPAAAQSFSATTFTAVAFGTTDYNTGAGYSTTSNLFTAPTAGDYFVFASVFMLPAASSYRAVLMLYLNGAETARPVDNTIAASIQTSLTGALPIRMAAGDTLGVTLWTGIATSTYYNASPPYFTQFVVRKMG